MRVYHVSLKPLGQSVTFKPRVPNNTFTKMGYEENKTKRISVTSTIEDALSGLSGPINGAKIYIYIADVERKDMKTTDEITKYVPDAHLTNELWILKDTTFALAGEGIVKEPKGKKGKGYTEPLLFTYGKNQEGQVWYWDYEITKWDSKIKK